MYFAKGIFSLMFIPKPHSMSKAFFSNFTFEKITKLQPGEYDLCSFSHCDFSESDFSALKFSDCTFVSCNLSLVKLDRTALQNVRFQDCKLLGLRFDACNNFGMELAFEDCMLDHASFFQIKISRTVFKNCRLREADFTEANLTAAVFENCDLSQAVFDRTHLEKADFRSAYGYTIHPDFNRIKLAKFSQSGLAGLLQQYDILIE